MEVDLCTLRIPHLPTSSNFPEHWAIPPVRLHGDWLLAYARTLQHVGEVAHRRSWCCNGDNYTRQLSLLVDAFLEVTDAWLVKADIIHCWNASEGDILQQCDTGCFTEVVSYLDELTTQPPTWDTWDALVFPMPTEGEDPRCHSLILDYVPRQPVNLE